MERWAFQLIQEARYSTEEKIYPATSEREWLQSVCLLPLSMLGTCSFKLGKAHICLVVLMRLQLRGGKRKNEAGCIWIQLEAISALFPPEARPTRIAAVVFGHGLADAKVCQHLDSGEKNMGVGAGHEIRLCLWEFL